MPGQQTRAERGRAGLDRWWQEHSELDRLVETLDETIGRGDEAAASAALEELVEAMHSHFAVEEDVYFPLVESLLPDSSEALRLARLAHVRIREDLATMSERIDAGELAPAREGLLERLRDHERVEARLIARLGG
jgi:hemerythrin-like domain-containing protein